MRKNKTQIKKLSFIHKLKNVVNKYLHPIPSYSAILTSTYHFNSVATVYIARVMSKFRYIFGCFVAEGRQGRKIYIVIDNTLDIVTLFCMFS